MTPATREKYPIPARLNVVLSIAQVLGGLALLWGGSHAAQPLVVLCMGIVFAFWMQMAFSLIHEAEHNKLHPSQAINDVLGAVLGATFPGSYTFMKAAHLSHHRKNRSDAELVDYILPKESKPAKWLQYYALICGLNWFGVPLLSLVIALLPFRTKKPKQSPKGGAAAYLQFIQEANPWRVRAEALFAVAFWVVAFYALSLSPMVVTLFYIGFAFSWSSQQYIYHIRTPRHLVEGAYNLRLWAPLQALYLNFNYHLSHHRDVRVPWIHMRNFPAEPTTRGYFATYLEIWAPPEKVANAFPVEFQNTGPLPPRSKRSEPGPTDAATLATQ